MGHRAGPQVPSVLGCPDVRRLKWATRSWKGSGSKTPVSPLNARERVGGAEGCSRNRLHPGLPDPPAIPPSGARVALASVTVAGWLSRRPLVGPFLLYSVQTLPRRGQGTSWSCWSVAQLLFFPRATLSLDLVFQNCNSKMCKAGYCVLCCQR